MPPLGQVMNSLTDWATALEATDTLALRDLLRLLVERDTPRRVKWGVYSAYIEWTPLGTALAGLRDAA